MHNQEQFKKEIVPECFKQSCLSSSQSELNLCGFIRIRMNGGPDLGGCYHQPCLKGRPLLAIYVCRAGATAKIAQIWTSRHVTNHQLSLCNVEFPCCFLQQELGQGHQF